MMVTSGNGYLLAPVSVTNLLISPGMAITTANRKIAPMIGAPMTAAMTARGASRRGFFVSSANVLAVSRAEITNSGMNMAARKVAVGLLVLRELVSVKAG